MKEWIIEAFKWIATVTDAYFATTLPQETWDALVDTCIEWGTLAIKYFNFFMSVIRG